MSKLSNSTNSKCSKSSNGQPSARAVAPRLGEMPHDWGTDTFRESFFDVLELGDIVRVAVSDERDGKVVKPDRTLRSSKSSTGLSGAAREIRTTRWILLSRSTRATSFHFGPAASSRSPLNGNRSASRRGCVPSSLAVYCGTCVPEIRCRRRMRG